MSLVMLASVLGGTTTTSAIYQTVITGNIAWLWLLALNVLWFGLCLWGTTLVENEGWVNE